MTEVVECLPEKQEAEFKSHINKYDFSLGYAIMALKQTSVICCHI
jgi:hypothetical protein